MIDVWILTVVVLHKGVTSFQLKFYSEQEARDAARDQLERMYSESYITSVTKTQEQKIN